MLPVSIIIAGIGKPPDDFEVMRELDADNGFLKGQKRDNVQFLSLKEFQDDDKLLT